MPVSAVAVQLELQLLQLLVLHIHALSSGHHLLHKGTWREDLGISNLH
jgi:hypothetical protein